MNHIKNSQNIFFALLSLLLFVVDASATNYFVSTDGVDDPSNGSIAFPFRTIQYGSNQLLPGDSLIVRGGTYFENVFLNTAGSVLSPISISSYIDETAIIDGTGTAGTALFVISSKSHVNISGFIFQNMYLQAAKGIYILGEGEGITITACEVRNIGWSNDAGADPYSVSPTGQAHGILVNGRTTAGMTDISITNCKIHDIVSGNSEALTFVGNVSEFEIAYVEVYDTKNIGIDVAGHYSWAVDAGVDPSLNQSRSGSIHHCTVYNNKRISNIDAPAGIYADGAKDVLIYSNTVHNNGNGMSVGCENAGFSATNIVVVNNLIYNNDNQGVYFGSNAATINSCILKNNTIVGNGTIGTFYSEVSLQNSTDCIIAQNILIPRVASNYAVSIFGYTVTNLTVDNNLAYRYSGDLTNIYVPGSPSQFSESNTTFENPAFVDSLIGSLDINLRQQSPAIDKGSTIFETNVITDIFDSYRTVNGKLDLGASESAIGNCPQSIVVDDSYTLSGLFTARDSMSFDLSQLTIQDELVISCPVINFVKSSIDNTQIVVRATGCVNE